MEITYETLSSEDTEEGRNREMTAMAFWPGESPFSILILVLYILLEYGFPALLVGLVIWRVLKAREYRRAEEIEKHVIVTRQIKEMLRRDPTRRQTNTTKQAIPKKVSVK